MRTRVLFALAAMALGLMACSAAESGNTTRQGASGEAGAAGADSGPILTDGAAGGDGAVPIFDALEESAPSTGEVYAHSADTLYKLEPISKTVTVVGKFPCVDFDTSGGLGMWDIALDKDGKMFGSLKDSTMGGKLVSIDKSTAACSTVASGNSLPNSMAFVPAGVLDPDQEVLVGFDQSSYVRIDKTTGAVSTIGSLNPNSTGKTLESSGDVVSIIGGGTYATVVDSYGTGADMIVEIDPKTGEATKLIGVTGFYDIWGLGYWGGIAYGFNEPGKLIQIDLMSGKGTEIPMSLPGSVSFWGAGVTTAAPIEIPK
jgi:hypothetical protein